MALKRILVPLTFSILQLLQRSSADCSSCCSDALTEGLAIDVELCNAGCEGTCESGDESCDAGVLFSTAGQVQRLFGKQICCSELGNVFTGNIASTVQQSCANDVTEEPEPTSAPTDPPVDAPIDTETPTTFPTTSPPTEKPTTFPTTKSPTTFPTTAPPTNAPVAEETKNPTKFPTILEEANDDGDDDSDRRRKLFAGLLTSFAFIGLFGVLLFMRRKPSDDGSRVEYRDPRRTSKRNSMFQGSNGEKPSSRLDQISFPNESRNASKRFEMQPMTDEGVPHYLHEKKGEKEKKTPPAKKPSLNLNNKNKMDDEEDQWGARPTPHYLQEARKSGYQQSIFTPSKEYLEKHAKRLSKMFTSEKKNSEPDLKEQEL